MSSVTAESIYSDAATLGKTSSYIYLIVAIVIAVILVIYALHINSQPQKPSVKAFIITASCTTFNNGTGNRNNNISSLKRFNLSEEFLTINGIVLENGVKIDSLVLPNISTITIGRKKQGLFNSIPVVELKNSNPYLKVNDLSNVVIEKEKKIYQKHKFWFSVGTALGIVGTYLLITSIK